MSGEYFVYFGIAATLVLSGCGPNPESARATTTAVAPQVKPEEQLKNIQREIIRLASLQPTGSVVRTVYLEDISVFNPIFKSRTFSGSTTEDNAQISFINTKLSPNPRFRYTLFRDQSAANYHTIDQLDVLISFSPFWLNSTDQGKLLSMEKEAYNLALWNSFCQGALATYRAQGRIDLIDPTVTEDELASTLGKQLLIENRLMQKLYDYAGYLANMPKVGRLLKLQDPQINKDLFEYSNEGTIYQMAEDKGIKMSLEFGSAEFLAIAFDVNGPWGKMIADPSVGAPPSPIIRP